MKKQCRTLLHIIMAVIGCITLSVYTFGQDIEKGTVEATGLVGFVSGLSGTHVTAGGSVGSEIIDHVLVSGELTYIPLQNNSINILGVTSEVNEKAIDFNLGGQYQFKRSGKIAPYAGGGLGVLHTSLSGSTSIVSTSLSVSGNDFYANLGGGARYYVNDRWGFKPELMIFFGSTTFVRLSAGLFFQFGK